MPFRPRRPPPLWPHEQDELVTKLRHGIGLEQLVGEQAAREIRATLPRPAPPPSRTHEPAAAPRPADPDAEIKAIARLGRGHQLGRTWRR